MNTEKLILEGKICPYCNNKSVLVDSKIVYKNISYGLIYYCAPCKAWTRVHKNSIKSYGSLANKKLRNLRHVSHKYFDHLWKTGKINFVTGKYRKHNPRKKAYRWLAEKLNIPIRYCHIGYFSVKECVKTIKICKKYYR